MEIYLDNSATTRVADPVAKVMLDMLTLDYGNPSSSHRKGFSAEGRVRDARAAVAALLSAAPEEITFTSCGSEANNLALLGACRANRRKGGRLITAAVEHESVLAPARQLEKEGFSAAFVLPTLEGKIDPEAVAALVDRETLLVSVMAVNSETGAVNDIPRIAKLAKHKNPKVLIHCDAVQAYGKIPLRPAQWGVDLMTMSAHKIHGPKGVGALYRNAKSGLRLSPLYFGSGQENGLHPGTENTPAICGFGAAAQLAFQSQQENWKIVDGLNRYFREKCGEIPGICINSPDDATPYIVNISIPKKKSQPMINFLAEAGIYVSGGSACTPKGKRSHVLTAMGLSDRRIDGALRVSFSPQNTAEQLDIFFERLREGLATLAGDR